MKKFAFNELMEEIENRRKRTGKSQQDVANYLEVSLRTYINYEGQKVSIPGEKLLNLCLLFEIDLNKFIDSGQIENFTNETEIEKVNNKIDELAKLMQQGFKAIETKLDTGKQIGEGKEDETQS